VAQGEWRSTTALIAQAARVVQQESPMTVFYLGDHDSSGRKIETDLGERVRRYGAKFTVKRLAIHAAHITKFDLPPLRVKEMDSREAGFLRRYSHKCMELDALPPMELRRRIEQQ
jgi:hypothetical protein